MKPLLVVNCGQLLSFAGIRRPRTKTEMTDVGLIRNGAVLIRDGRVMAVGGTKELQRLLPSDRARRLDAAGRVVLPGFVDSHTHALFPKPRLEEYVARIRGMTYEAIAEKGGGIQASARATKRASEQDLVAHLKRMGALFLEHGTTTAEVKSGYGLVPREELKLLQVIRQVGRAAPFDWVPTLLAQDVPRSLRGRRAQYVDTIMPPLIRQVAREKLARFFDVFCDKGYFTVAEMRRLFRVAAEAGLQLKAHAEQLAHTGAARAAAELGAITVDHADRLSDADVRWLSRTPTMVTLLPGSTFHLGLGRYPAARTLIDGGVAVALATNCNPGSSPTVNMQMILSLACTQMQMTPEEALTAATINGAWALGRADEIGSLEVGKQADLLVMDVRDYREIPYFFGMNHCRAVLKKGRLVLPRRKRDRAS
jgi:imidazolonepropionase